MDKEINLVLSNTKCTFTITFNYVDFVIVLKQVCRKYKINHNFNTFWVLETKKDFVREHRINQFLQEYFNHENDIRKYMVNELKMQKFALNSQYHKVYINQRDAIDFMVEFNHPHHGDKIYKSNVICLKQAPTTPDMPPNWQDFTHTSQLYENDMYYI